MALINFSSLTPTSLPLRELPWHLKSLSIKSISLTSINFSLKWTLPRYTLFNLWTYFHSPVLSIRLFIISIFLPLSLSKNMPKMKLISPIFSLTLSIQIFINYLLICSLQLPESIFNKLFNSGLILFPINITSHFIIKSITLFIILILLFMTLN
jgi:hypothetical protein